MEEESYGKGILYVGLCAFLWNLGGLLIKLIDYNPTAIFYAAHMFLYVIA